MPANPAPLVCFVAPFGLGQKTTVWARTLPLAQELVRQGFRATILIPPWDTPADAGKSWTDGGVDLVNVTIGGGAPLITRRLVQALAARRPDLVHIVKPRAHAGLVQAWLWQRHHWPGSSRSTARRIPLLLDTDDWEQAWQPINRYSPPVARFLAWQEEWGLRHADGITAASRWLEARAHAYSPQTPVLYLPNGITPPAPSAVRWTPSGSCNVLFFTRFVEVTPDWLAACWQTLHAQLPAARLLVAGDPVQPGLEAPFRAAIAATGAPADAVEWLGYVNREELAVLYARTGCAIFPAADVPLQQAKCSVRLATTLLQGLPVVASAVGEQANYGAHGAARLVPAAATPQQFAAAVAAVLAQPEAQLALSAAARDQLLARYAWPALAHQLAAFYAQFLP